MIDQPRKSKSYSRYGAQQDAAVRILAAAAQHAKAANTRASHDDLTAAVDAARAAGVGWTRIGDTLGIASGNAYRRYRKRPASTEQRCEAGGPHC